MKIKKLIAKNIITQYHDAEKADEAEEFFVNQFQNKNLDVKSFVPVLISTLENESDKIALIDLCASLKNEITKSANRRLIESGAVQVNNVKITNPYESIALQKETKIKIGKRSFYELR
ncbi:S4 domain-containing protein [Flavobacterium foetidum]|uniref:S4 domain-containing protein n=1 Tax=Flavobacterium foetidum TaxID=2026681 RepID=UPI001FC954CC|nr:S4 domain-containing protein [Flavobacterium foetidum]